MSRRVDDLVTHMLHRVEPVDSTGCWIWQGWCDRDGYGHISRTVAQRFNISHIAHRALYQLLIGPIPHDLTIDHLCRNPPCVNPRHLEPVTRKVNTLRGETIPAAHAAKTHCINGHPFDGPNTYITPAGHRDCRACNRDRTRRYLSARANRIEGQVHP